MITNLTPKFGPFTITRVRLLEKDKMLSKGASLRFYILGAIGEYVAFQVIAVFPGGGTLVLFQKIYVKIDKHWANNPDVKMCCNRLELGDESIIPFIKNRIKDVLNITLYQEGDGIRFLYKISKTPFKVNPLDKDSARPDGRTKKHQNHIPGLISQKQKYINPNHD